MAMELQGISLSVKNDDASFTISDIKDGSADDSLLMFARAYSSLQETKDAKYITRKVYAVV